MTNWRESKRLLLVLALSFLVQSCAGTPDRKPLQKPAPKPASAPISAAQHVAAGRYQKAIDAYAAEYRIRPQDQALVKNYAKGLEDIKRVADQAVGKKSFASAGKIYDLLLRNSSKFTGIFPKLSFDKAQLNAQLSDCRKDLATQGFQEYRKGNLVEAIALWRSLLAIDPANADIKAALATAVRQQKNLQDSAGE